jgi:hypothetical protein
MYTKPRRYRTPDAAAYLEVSKSFLDKERTAGRGPAYERIANKIYYPEAELDAYRESCRVQPPNNSHSDSAA